MESNIPPVMKPVLVTEVTDDVRKLRGTPVEQQQRVLSAYALNDLLAGAVIDPYEPSDYDKQYVVAIPREDTGEIFKYVDLDKVVQSGCRYVKVDQYINGPKFSEITVREGDVTRTYLPDGIIHTFAQLPDGKLTWAKYDDYRSIQSPNENKDDGEGKRGDPDVRHPFDGAVIRQFFYTNNESVNDSNSYTRIGKYDAANDEYVWGDWAWTSGEKIFVVITEDNMPADGVLNPMINAIYSIHCSLSKIVLPDAAGFRNGSSITIIQNPDPREEDRSLWASLVVDATSQKRLMLTPSPVRNTAKRRGAHLEELAPTEYEFVVTPVIDRDTKEETGRTWELAVDAEETDFTTGIADLLAAHTDPGINDIINYEARKYTEEDPAIPQSATAPISITRAMPTKGYVSGKLTKLSDNLFDGWSIDIKKITVTGAVNPNFQITLDTVPVLEKVYFVKRINNDGTFTFMLAMDPEYPECEPGHLNPERGAFPTTEEAYYELSDNAQLVTTTILNRAASTLVTGTTLRFEEYFNRHDLLFITITPAQNQSHIEVRDEGLVRALISYVPDPHEGAYIAKKQLNPYAYSEQQLHIAKKFGDMCAQGDGIDSSKVPASTAALILAYNDLAERLQKRGLLTGVVNVGEIDDAGLNALTETGLYNISVKTGETTTVPKTVEGGWPRELIGSADFHGTCYLEVIGGTVAGSDVLNANDQFDITKDKRPTYYEFVLTTDETMIPGKMYYEHTGPGPDDYTRTADTTFIPGKDYYEYHETYDKLYYVWNNNERKFELAPVGGHPQSFNPDTDYYEKVKSIETGKACIQTLTSIANMLSRKWTRFYRAGVWAPWRKQDLGEVIATWDVTEPHTDYPYSPADQISDMLAHGKPRLKITHLLPSQTFNINFWLDPNEISGDEGTEIILELWGDPTATVNIRYLSVSNPYGSGDTVYRCLKVSPNSAGATVVTMRSITNDTGAYWAAKIDTLIIGELDNS